MRCVCAAEFPGVLQFKGLSVNRKGHSRHEQQGASTKARPCRPSGRRAATRCAGQARCAELARASRCSHAARRRPAGWGSWWPAGRAVWRAGASRSSSRQPGGSFARWRWWCLCRSTAAARIGGARARSVACERAARVCGGCAQATPRAVAQARRLDGPGGGAGVRFRRRRLRPVVLSSA